MNNLTFFLTLQRPYDIHSSTSIHEAKQMFTTLKVHYSSNWHSGCKDLIKQVITEYLIKQVIIEDLIRQDIREDLIK